MGAVILRVLEPKPGSRWGEGRSQPVRPAARLARRARARDRFLRILAGLAAADVVFLGLLYAEWRTSWLEAHLFARFARAVRYELAAGPAGPTDAVLAPVGPYDQRLGYAHLPAVLGRLTARGYRVIAQARGSRAFRVLGRLGIFPPYREKTQAGLTVLDRAGRPLYRALRPERVYPDFDAIPPVVVRSVVFLENRELLEEQPYRNPAVEWDRLAAAVAHSTLGRWLGAERVFGASTLATQMEKFRHSPGGLTGSPLDKVRQMAAASLRSYLDGPATVSARRRIVTAYLNALPLGAVPGYGEVIGLGDGLWAWFGMEFEAANRLLRRAGSSERVGPAEARAYRAVLSLLLGQRRPSYYLADAAGHRALARLTDAYLGLLVREGVIGRRLARAARAVQLAPRARAPARAAVPFVERKAANAVRIELLELLGAEHLSRLDAQDLLVRTTVDSQAQAAVTERLRRLADPRAVAAAGLLAPRLLERGDPARWPTASCSTSAPRRATCSGYRPTTWSAPSTSTRGRDWSWGPRPNSGPWSATWKWSSACTTRCGPIRTGRRSVRAPAVAGTIP